MIVRRISAIGLITAAALLALSGQAGASMIPLDLTCQAVSGGGGNACPPSAQMYAVPGQYNYGDSFGTSVANGSITGSDIYGGSTYGNLGSAGFIDDYYFAIGGASADAVSATISDATHAVTGLFATLYSLSSNPDGLVLTQPAGTVYYGDVTNVDGATLVQINPVTLAAGSYILQISGTASGSGGGSYTGTLNLSPVPLPGSFLLLLTGLLGFAGLVLPRQRKR